MKILALLATVAVAASTVQAAAPGGNGRLAFQTPDGDSSRVAVVNADGSGLRDLVEGAAPAWAPASLRIAYAADGVLRVADLAAGTSADLLSAAGFALSSPAWSADGTKLVFVGEEIATGRVDLWSANADGTGLARVTDDDAVDAEPTWTPDGAKIVFATDRDGNFEIYSVNPDGTSPARLTNDAAPDRDPDVSPDGTKIVFVRDADALEAALWTMDLDGANAAAFTDGSFPAVAPAFSPDGLLLAFAGAPEADFEIWTIGVDGNGLALVTGGEGDQTLPSWQSIVAGENAPPTADAGDGGEVECTSPAGADVALDGSASSDPDDTDTTSDIVLYEWFEDFGSDTEVFLGAGVNLTVPFDFGPHAVTLQVTDSVGQSATVEVVFVIVDTTPPVIRLKVTPNVIWPPNHKMVRIHANVEATDVCSPEVVVKLVSVTSNEPDNDTGDGNFPNDIQGVAAGTADFDFLVRAERKGNGSGRVYTATYSATDASENTSQAAADIRVPHDQRGIRAEATDAARGSKKKGSAVPRGSASRQR
ncbi:MAG TPA: hypothetical protein VF139_00650 [Candidatus Polarisedimenticolaceae bacterium]